MTSLGDNKVKLLQYMFIYNLLVNFFLIKFFPVIIGIVSLFRGIGCFAGPFIGGLIADNEYIGELIKESKSNTMSIAFYFCGACYFIGFVFSAIVSFSPVKKAEKNNELQAS